VSFVRDRFPKGGKKPIGVALGLGLASAASAGMKILFVFDPGIVAIAFAFSALIGVVFGYFPPRRAARPDRRAPP